MGCFWIIPKLQVDYWVYHIICYPCRRRNGAVKRNGVKAKRTLYRSCGIGISTTCSTVRCWIRFCSMIFGTWTICSRTTSTSCCVTCSNTSHRRPGILIQAGVFTLATFNYSQKMLWKCWENWEHLKPPARNMCGWGGVPNICVPGLWHFHHFVDDLHLRNLLFFHYLLDGGDLHDLLNLLTWKHETARATQSTHCIACTQSSLHFCCSEIAGTSILIGCTAFSPANSWMARRFCQQGWVQPPTLCFPTFHYFLLTLHGDLRWRVHFGVDACHIFGLALGSHGLNHGAMLSFQEGLPCETLDCLDCFHLTQKLQQPHYPPYAVLCSTQCKVALSWTTFVPGLARILDTLHGDLHLSGGAHDGSTDRSLGLRCQGIRGDRRLSGGHSVHCGIDGLRYHGLSAFVDHGRGAITHLRAPWFADKPTVSCGKSRQIMVNPIVNLHVGWFIHVYTTHVWKMCLNHAPFTSICTVTYHLVDVWTIQNSNDFLLCWPHWHEC